MLLISSFCCNCILSCLDISEGTWGKDELVESSEEGSHESVWFREIDFTGTVYIKLSPCSWEELCHVGFHLGFWDLLGDKKDFSCGFLGSTLVEDFLAGWNTCSISNWDGVVTENVVIDIIVVGTVVSWGWGISGSWGTGLLLLGEFNCVGWLNLG